MPSRRSRKRSWWRREPLFGTLEYFEPVDEANRALASSLIVGDWEVTRAVWREVRIVGAAAAGMTLVVWTVRVVSQLLDVAWLNEAILSGHWNDYVVQIENRVDLADRKNGG